MARASNYRQCRSKRQPLFTPPISDCICGSPARLYDWNFVDMWKVRCEKCYEIQMPENLTQNRAVHKWNNKIKALKEQQGE